MFDLKKLTELKDKLTTAESFKDVMEFFFDHCGDNPAFMALGKRVRSPYMKALIKRVGEELLGESVQVHNTTFVQLKKQRFMHGSAHINGLMLVFFFFKDIDMGLLGCQVGEMSRFVRFSSYTVKGKDPQSVSLPLSLPPIRHTTH